MSKDRYQTLRQTAVKQKEVVRLRYGQNALYYWGTFVFLRQAE